jgi:colanic acid biosynthesis glycosyl transferase WcaI
MMDPCSRLFHDLPLIVQLHWRRGYYIMHILLVTINYPPEIGGAPHLIHQLALGLQERGHQVTVLTGYPSYNLQVIPSQYRRGLWMCETLDSICVRRVRIPSLPRTSKVARGVQHFIFGLWLAALTSLSPRADVALVFSPPLPLPWLVCMVGKIRCMPAVVNIQDLFPRQAVELGMLSNPLLIRLFERMERQMHRLASAITVHSPGNRAHVIQQGGRAERVRVIYNWVNTEHIRPGQRYNGFAHQYGLEDRFVVSYAGTMGWAQDMGTIIASAAWLRDRPDILFLLVGDGVEKEKAQARSIELGLNNIIWLPMQPWSVYPEILAASDISLINLHPELHTPVVPSKLLSIMAAGRPVVASLPPESDARQIVTEADCGICVEAGDGEALAGAILSLYSDRSRGREMGQRGRAYVEAHFSYQACVSQMETIFKNIMGEIQ